MTEFTLSSCSFSDRKVTSALQISRALHELNSGTIEFLILAREPERYVQSVCDDGGYIVEHRDGSEDTHMSAVLLPDGRKLRIDDAEAVFQSYFRNAPFPRNIDWKREDLSDAAPVYGLAAIGLLVVLLVGAAWWGLA